VWTCKSPARLASALKEQPSMVAALLRWVRQRASGSALSTDVCRATKILRRLCIQVDPVVTQLMNSGIALDVCAMLRSDVAAERSVAAMLLPELVRKQHRNMLFLCAAGMHVAAAETLTAAVLNKAPLPFAGVMALLAWLCMALETPFPVQERDPRAKVVLQVGVPVSNVAGIRDALARLLDPKFEGEPSVSAAADPAQVARDRDSQARMSLCLRIQAKISGLNHFALAGDCV